MTPTNPITEARDHYFTLKVFVPSKVTCTEDRLRWYFDHAIRGYYKQFALETDPIRGMLDCSVTVEKTPLKAETQAAEIERWRNLQGPADEAAQEITNLLLGAGTSLTLPAHEPEPGSKDDYGCVWGGIVKDVEHLLAEHDTLKAKLAKAEEVIKPFADAANIRLCGEWADNERFGRTDISNYLTFGHLRAAAQFTKEREGL